MFSLGVVERSWEEEEGRVPPQGSPLPAKGPGMGMGMEYGSGPGAMSGGPGGAGGPAFSFAPHIRGPFAGSGERQRSPPFTSSTPPPTTAPHQPTWSRYTPMDFELLLHEGRQFTEDMRRSVAYLKWYNNKRMHDNRLPPPLTDVRYGARDAVEAPWDGDSATRVSSQGGMPISGGGGVSGAAVGGGAGGGANMDTGKSGFRLELDAKNLQQAHEQQCFNPYAAGFQHRDDNLLSPGTQFFGAYAPTPLATMATPNTLRAYAHSRMATQNRSGSTNNERDPSQSLTQVPNTTLYNNEWNTTGDFRTGSNVISNLGQQYYTQEPMNPFDYYTDPAVAGYYGTTAAGVAEASRMQSALMAMGSAGEMGMMRGGSGSGGAGGGGRGRRGGGGGGGRGRGASGSNANSSKWGPGGAKANGRGGPYREPLQPCSELLEQFRADAMNGATSQWRIAHIAGHAVEFAQDQEGSRFIQRAVDTATHDEVDALFHEIFESPLDLVTDIFGNYVLQKLLEIGNARQLAYAATRLQNNVVSLTLQTYGCRVIQKCIEVMPPEGLDIILAELQGNVAKCIQDQNGNHVVQKCVEVIPQRCGFIVSAFTGRVMELATHAYGCRVIQCIMEHCPDQEEAIFSELVQCVGTLAKDQYGNYVIQHVLQHMKDEDKVSRIFNALKNNFYECSKQKFASNVMEKIFVRASPKQRMELVELLCSPVEGVDHPMVEVLTFKRSPPVKKDTAEKQRSSGGAVAATASSSTTAAASASASTTTTTAVTAAPAGSSTTVEPVKKGRRDKEREREKESAGGPVVEVQSGGKEPPSMLCLMMQNQFANYVVQRVLDAADVDQFWCLIDNIQKFLLPISTYTYGAPIVQRLVRRELVKAPDDVVFNLSTAASGSGGGRGNYHHHNHHHHGHQRKDAADRSSDE
ncbi:pumilio/PUF RNA binding protein 6 [Trypanosoma theileri]|uniref:Pumilio/PUF RNA binding protein 6 n=1 Tax=Trypanosoma theileri TaxID=67003 RepID=A0A1X0P2G5_9TRYP|nr:pumilio/PUF RNA binding protein 6 [Trypanosoma theileri]ORC90570.1 pumilio/PUF RNA binding protein 6 [Trypanosoma theileri]